MKSFHLIQAAAPFWPRPLRTLSQDELEAGARQLRPQLVTPLTSASDVAFLAATCGAYCRVKDRQWWEEGAA